MVLDNKYGFLVLPSLSLELIVSWSRSLVIYLENVIVFIFKVGDDFLMFNRLIS